MSTYSETVKEKLNEIIKKIQQSPNSFVKNPGKDFSRDSKLGLAQMMHLILSMSSNSLNNELLQYFNYDEKTATASAFVQQREKILPSAFKFLFHQFTDSFPNLKTFEGFRLLADDGSSLNIAYNPKDSDTFFPGTTGAKGFNQLHLNAMFDICNKIHVDAIVQPGRKANESGALTEMVDRSNIEGDVILLADRGYEGYNVFAHLEEKGWHYAIRVKDVASNGILGGLKLPDKDEFDTTLRLTLTRKKTNAVKRQPDIYRILKKNTTFDYLEENEFYNISLRIVRFRLTDDSYECIITNLDPFRFPPQKIKRLYFMRWGIETSFRELKYTIGLSCFHAKKTNSITQEIFARLTMYNFCELITMNVVVTKKDTKHVYQVNFTAAIWICRNFFRYQGNGNPPAVETLILRYILPVRPGRKDPRKVRSKSTVCFNYRVA